MSNYIKIPDFVRYNQNLKASSKLMFGEIWALTSKEGYCFATNSYFANVYGLSKTTISDCISQLHDVVATHEVAVADDSNTIGDALYLFELV